MGSNTNVFAPGFTKENLSTVDCYSIPLFWMEDNNQEKCI